MESNLVIRLFLLALAWYESNIRQHKRKEKKAYYRPKNSKGKKVKQMCNNDSFAMIDNAINLYKNGLLSVQETTGKVFHEIDNYTWFISDPDIRIKAQNVLYKRFFDKMHKAVIQTERR